MNTYISFTNNHILCVTKMGEILAQNPSVTEEILESGQL